MCKSFRRNPFADRAVLIQRWGWYGLPSVCLHWLVHHVTSVTLSLQGNVLSLEQGQNKLLFVSDLCPCGPLLGVSLHQGSTLMWAWYQSFYCNSNLCSCDGLQRPSKLTDNCFLIKYSVVSKEGCLNFIFSICWFGFLISHLNPPTQSKHVPSYSCCLLWIVLFNK